MNIRRREFLSASAGTVAALSFGRSGWAGAGEAILATWAGDYGNLLEANVEKAILEPKGIKTVRQIGDQPTRVAKVYAERDLSKGSFDLLALNASGAFELYDAGLLETLTPDKIPNFANLLPVFKQDYFVVNIYSPQVIVYNPELVSTPPTTLGDFLKPEYAGKVGMVDDNGFYEMMGAALYTAGTPNDLEGAKKYFLDLKKNGMRMYPTLENLPAAFKSGEVVATITWLARCIMWQNAGLNIKPAFQKEGAVLYSSGLVIPKNAPNKEYAFAYANALLDPSVGKVFAQKMGYLPTITNAGLTGDVADRLKLPEPAPKIVTPDYKFAAEAQADTWDWWRKTLQAG